MSFSSRSAAMLSPQATCRGHITVQSGFTNENSEMRICKSLHADMRTNRLTTIGEDASIRPPVSRPPLRSWDGIAGFDNDEGGVSCHAIVTRCAVH